MCHTAPGHGMDDYITGLKHGLEIYPCRDNGRYIDDGRIPTRVGLTVAEKSGRCEANDSRDSSRYRFSSLFRKLQAQLPVLLAQKLPWYSGHGSMVRLAR